MTFRYEPLTGGELFENAERFARERDAAGLVARDRIAQMALDAATWDAVAALGWPLSRVPEAAGGVGGTLEDALALVEGAARFALPIPLAPSLLIAPVLLDAHWAARIADGSMVPSVVLDDAYPWAAARGHGPGRLELDGGHLTGKVVGTEMTSGATHFLVAIGTQVAVVAAPHADVRSFLRIDARLAADITFSGAPVEAILPGGGLADAIALGALCACIEIVAGAATVIEDSVAYLNERHQFGVPLSSFQVLRHYVADMFIAYQNAHAVTASAIRATAAGAGERSVSIAKLRTGEVGSFIAETAIQVHGGMGMTEENRATRIGKRLLMADLEWGDRAWHAHVLRTELEPAE